MPISRRRTPRLLRLVQEQVDRITEAFCAEGVTVATEVAKDGGVSFMYAEGQILVREAYLDRVQDFLGQDPARQQVTHIIGDVRLLTLRPAVERKHSKVKVGVQPTVIFALNTIQQEFGDDIASPDYVVTVAPSSPCPATEPQPVYADSEPFPGICTGNSGAGVLVYVADTGLMKHAEDGRPWLDGVQRAERPNGSLQPWETVLRPDPVNHAMRIPPYAGHGTFVAGVIRTQAPAAEVIVSNAFNVAGSRLESEFVPDLARALAQGVDIFHLSVSTPTRHSRPMIAFGAWLELLAEYKGVVCVVAAGNDGSRQPSWPAAFAETVSVGALTADGRDRADFSNFGGWVDVYAPGRDLINAYPTGTYKCEDDPYKGQLRKFHGMCKWSGTSFSTPVVTGLIAARMSRTGENGKEAAAALLALARSQAIPGVGAVLLPCQAGRCGDGGCDCHERHQDCGCRRGRC